MPRGESESRFLHYPRDLFERLNQLCDAHDALRKKDKSLEVSLKNANDENEGDISVLVEINPTVRKSLLSCYELEIRETIMFLKNNGYTVELPAEIAF